MNINEGINETLCIVRNKRRNVRMSHDAASTNMRSSVLGGFSSKLDTSSKSPERFSRNERHLRLKEMYTSSSLRQNYFQKNGRLKNRPKVEIDIIEQKQVGNCQFLNIMEPVSTKRPKSIR